MSNLLREAIRMIWVWIFKSNSGQKAAIFLKFEIRCEWSWFVVIKAVKACDLKEWWWVFILQTFR